MSPVLYQPAAARRTARTTRYPARKAGLNMASSQPVPENVQLRYGNAAVFDRADTRAKEIAHLMPGDPVTVLAAEGEFYRVQLPDGVVGFVFAHNLTGTDMPLTVSEQDHADRRAEAAARPPGGWRGMLRRLHR